MFRLVLVSALLIPAGGCTTTPKAGLAGKPVYFKHVNDDVFWENIIVYGRLKKETIRQPTQVYGSSFGHAYCMAQDVSFKVEQYVQGSGPDLIEFTQHVVDSCDALSADIGFGDALLFLSKNRWRGVWSTGVISLRRFDEEVRIFEPADIMKFTSFDDFEELLSTYTEPFEWGVEKNWESYETLEALRKLGILDFAIERMEWPEMPQPRREEVYAYDEYYVVKIYKYIKLETLLAHDF
jgi:hypothetical protein